MALEGRQFLEEMARAKASARDMAAGVRDGFGAAQRAGQGFQSGTAAMAAAMRGDLVGAATAGAAAVKSLTAAMAANPVMALVTALTALGAVIYKVAEANREYRARCAEAREENERFVESLNRLGTQGPVAAAEEKFRGQLEGGRERRITRSLARSEEDAAAAKERAEVAGAELLKLETAKKPDDAAIKSAREKRDAAVEEYKLQLEIVQRYRAMYADWQKAREEAAAKDAEAAKELREANRSAAERLEKRAAAGDVEAMTKILVRMEGEADEKFGGWGTYEARLREGTASREEIQARSEIDDWRGTVEAETRRQRDEAKRAAEAAAREAEQQAKAAAAERKQLARAREAAMVAAGDEAGLRRLSRKRTREADERFGTGFEQRIGTATKEELELREAASRAAREAETIRRAKAKSESSETPSKESEKPWAVGVTAVRGMSVADVFSNMRGMGGADMARDPNTELHRKTADGVGSIVRDVQKIAGSLAGDGVR